MLGSGGGTLVRGHPSRVRRPEDQPAGVLHLPYGDLDLTGPVQTQLITDLGEIQ